MATLRTLRSTLTRLAIAALVTLNGPAAAQDRLQTAALPASLASIPTYRAPSVLEAVRMESSMLSDIVEEFATGDLGEGPAADGLDDRTRELASAAAFAAIGDIEAAKRHAANALRYGATNGALKEVLYLTLIHAGAPRAIAATRAFEELLAD